MRQAGHGTLFFLMTASVALLCGMDGGVYGEDERAALLQKIKTQKSRIEVLRREQDALLYRKTMEDVDSKYLIIDLAKNSGQLRYKNRVLKDFTFTPSKRHSYRSLKQGMLTLTKKTEDNKKGFHELLFGGSLALRRSRSAVPPREQAVPFISLGKKDMQSVSHAVEEGATAYVLR
jgi:hypothetical protein